MKKSILVSLFLFMTSNVYAISLDDLTNKLDLGNGGTVGGRCWSDPPGGLATTNNVAKAASQTIEQINCGIDTMSQQLVEAIVKTSKATQETIQTGVNAQIGALKKQAELEKTDRIRQSLTSENSQPKDLCDKPEMASAYTNGRIAGGRMSASTKDFLTTRNNSNPDPSETKEFLIEVEDQDLDLASILTSKETLSAEEVAVANIDIAMASNTYPLRKSEEYNSSSDNKELEALRKEDLLKRSYSEKILADNLAYKTGTVEAGEYLNKRLEQMGSSLTAEDVAVEGKISLSYYYDLMSDSRIGNPNWFNSIANGTGEMLARETVLILADNLALQKDILDELKIMSNVLAQLNVNQLDTKRAGTSVER